MISAEEGMYRYEKVIKRHPITKQEQEAFEMLGRMDHEGNLILKRRKWIQYQLNEVCKDFSTWEIEYFIDLRGNNQTKSILKDISHISFPRLKALSVSQNCINSVEILQRIHFPCLEELDVSNNCITALRSVRKCLFLPNMKEISIGDNYARDLNQLFPFFSKTIERIRFHRRNSKRKKNVQQSLTFYVKLASNAFERQEIMKMSQFEAHSTKVANCMSK